MTAESRADIVRGLVGVDLVFIHEVKEHHQAALIERNLFDVFTKGGDRDFASLPIPEQEALLATNTITICNVGFDKKEGTKEEVSSSAMRAIARGD